ncbi:MAG: MaoC/PaaZ C-terminal domain-containing protein [Deltaproteobacteria bacterium]|nr:MaoC/PaaZ C-terminal domain-containing protein [Deltaproteobacteria bacterium]
MTFALDAVGREGPATEFTYSWRDTALYALGVGAKTSELDYLYEGRGPSVLPSFSVVPAFEPVMKAIEAIQGPMDQVVHGTQRVIMHRPFAPAATLLTTAVVEGLYDLKRMTQTTVKTRSVDKTTGELVCETAWGILFLGIGGVSTGTKPSEERPGAPSRDADFVFEERTLDEQALLYRLSGDFNPLHADPAFPLVSRFEGRPILHGLATYGFMVRAVVSQALGGKSDGIRAIQGRFSKPVWPGETLITEGWREGNRIFARTSVKERNEVVLSHCAIDTLEL